MPLSAAILETLYNIVGDIGFTTDQQAIAPYLVESRGRFHGYCDALIKPKSTQEVAHILALCNDENIPVVPQGGNTGHCGGAVPDGGVLINLSRLNQVRALDPLNATMTVEAGCILQNIQAAAQKHHYIFPLTLAAQGSCQIGGNIATNAGGMQVLKYGNMRDLVLGLEVVLADGRIWDGLRGLRKDNTGYDLPHLFIGSEGTLGIVTAAVLKLSPQPKESITVFVGAQSPADLMDGFAHFRDDFADDLSAFEIMPRFALDLVLKHVWGNRDPLSRPYPWYGLIEIGTARTHTGLRQSCETLLELLLSREIFSDALIAESLIQVKNLWALRENISDAQKQEGGSIKHDVSVPVSKISAFLDETSHMITNIMPDARICAFGHAGDGNIHFNVSQPTGMEKEFFLTHWNELNEIVHEMAAKYEGSFSAEHGIGLLKTEEMELYRHGPELDMMRAIKKALDPNGIMNPGKIIKI